MTLDEAIELFYKDERYQNEFDYWEIDGALAKVMTWLEDMQKIKEELEQKGGK